MKVPFFLLHLAEIVFRVENPFCGVMGGGGDGGGDGGGGEGGLCCCAEAEPKMDTR